MPHSYGPDFSFSRLKIHVFGPKLDTYATRAGPNLEFCALKSVFKFKIRHFMRHSCGPDFPFLRLKIHGFVYKLDTLCATRADTKLAFIALKYLFRVKN